MKIFTIGVFGSTEQQFFGKLIENNIDTFCDIRQRRGVRGSEYAFVNSNYLQRKLAEMDIRYGHIIELAPTTEIREKQKAVDLANGERKRDRTQLGHTFIREYKKHIENYDFDTLISHLDDIGANRVVFFCVEQYASACHRSIVAEELHKRFNFDVIHL